MKRLSTPSDLLRVKDLDFVLNPMIDLAHKHGQGEDLKRSCEITYESFIKYKNPVVYEL